MTQLTRYRPSIIFDARMAVQAARESITRTHGIPHRLPLIVLGGEQYVVDVRLQELRLVAMPGERRNLYDDEGFSEQERERLAEIITAEVELSDPIDL